MWRRIAVLQMKVLYKECVAGSGRTCELPTPAVRTTCLRRRWALATTMMMPGEKWSGDRSQRRLLRDRAVRPAQLVSTNAFHS